MPFKENREGKMFYTCDRCGIEFQFGPHIYRGRPGPKDTMLCLGCAPNPFERSASAEELAAIKKLLTT